MKCGKATAGVCPGSRRCRLAQLHSPGSGASGSPAGMGVSPSSNNGKLGLAILCPITSKIMGYPFEVALGSKGRIAGVVLSDQVISLDWRARDVEFIERVPANVVAQVLGRLATLIQ